MLGSSESEEDVMSEYEKLNLNKRKENKRMLDQLMASLAYCVFAVIYEPSSML